MQPASSGTIRLAAAFLAAFLAAAVNSVAGGGTLLSFPALVWLGLPSIMANATSTVGISAREPGEHLGLPARAFPDRLGLRALALPCLLGGASGALLLRATSTAAFNRLVPFLVLFATLLFAVRGKVQGWLLRRAGGERAAGVSPPLGILLTLAIGVYGGYFGAGMSIMNLSMLGVLGMTDLLEMNALTSLFSLCVNGTAIALFAAAGLVRWPVALAMAAGALLGGYGATGAARRVGKEALGHLVVLIGFTVSAIFFARLLW